MVPMVPVDRIDWLTDEAFGRLVEIWGRSPDEVRVFLLTVPERERWIYQRPEVIESIERGLEQARRGEFADGPSVEELMAEFGVDGDDDDEE